MRKIMLVSLLAVGASAAFADIDQSQLVNFPGGGTGAIAGANLSQLETGETIFGFGAAATGQVYADDFTLASSTTVTGITLYTYLTGSTSLSVTGVNYAIGAAPTGTLTAAAFTNNWMVGPGAQAVYRTNLGDTTSSNRRIQTIDITGLNINLSAGTYWLSWNQTGNSFAPPLPSSLATHGQNAVQSLDSGATFNPVHVDTAGTIGADMAFIVHTAAVPEPATFAAFGLGLVGIAALRRRRK